MFFYNGAIWTHVGLSGVQSEAVWTHLEPPGVIRGQGCMRLHIHHVLSQVVPHLAKGTT